MKLKKLKDEAGNALVEYTLMISLVGGASIVALTQLGLSVADVLNTIAGEL